jgi:hypothetical protein
MYGPERSSRALATVTRLRGALVVLTLGAAACGDRVTQPSARPRPGSPPALDVHGNWGQRGRLVDATLVRTIDQSTVAGAIRTAVAQNEPGLSAASKAAIQESAVAAFETHYDVEQWSIKYTTVGVHGELVVVSAGVYLPAGVAGPLPLVSVSHGTLTEKSNVPSNTGIIAQGIGHASHGSVAVFADYIGMGTDAGDFPPYLVADVGATTSLDALRATRELLKQKDLSLDGRLFISGYSQGGQVSRALARLIESDPRSRFRVTAAAPAAGPYDLYGSARVAFSRTTAYVPLSIYVIYGVSALNASYGLADRLDELLTPNAAAVGEKLLTTGMGQAELVSGDAARRAERLPLQLRGSHVLRPERSTFGRSARGEPRRCAAGESDLRLATERAIAHVLRRGGHRRADNERPNDGGAHVRSGCERHRRRVRGAERAGGRKAESWYRPLAIDHRIAEVVRQLSGTRCYARRRDRPRHFRPELAPRGDLQCERRGRWIAAPLA